MDCLEISIINSLQKGTARFLYLNMENECSKNSQERKKIVINLNNLTSETHSENPKSGVQKPNFEIKEFDFGSLI